MSTIVAPPASDPIAPSARSSQLPRVAGLLLLALSLPPWYLLLKHPRTGVAGNNVVAQYEIYTELMWTGLLLVGSFAAIGGLIAARVNSLPSLSLPRLRYGHVTHAAILALVCFVLTLVFSLAVLEGKPNLIDGLAQALHARFWSEGRLAGPVSDGGGHWSIQNALFTQQGWVSQYPPGHVALLAAGFRLGAPWIVGPLLAALTVCFAALLAAQLFPRDRWIARVGPSLLAVSPFFIALSGAYMNHVTTAACVTVGAYALLRAWRGTPAWAYAAGLVMGLSFATRPLATIAMAIALAFTLPAAGSVPVSIRTFATINARAIAGAVPFITALFMYNAHFFGNAFRMGYDVALGPAMGLGFHQDPWGNTYGLREALAYTSGDLLTLGINLFETPLSALLVIGVFLLRARTLEPATRVLLAWACAPVLANSLYWHHGLFMGPRMLHEAAPAWALLFGVAALTLVRTLPRLPHFDVRAAAGIAIFGSLALGIGHLAPQRLASYGGGWFDIMRLPVPELDGPGIVFVHDAWVGRIAMTLAASGYRLDEVETLMRQNSTCAVHEHVRHLVRQDHAAADASLRALDTAPRADRLPPQIEIARADRIRAWPGERLSEACMREVRSDRFGILDVAPLVWQGDVPGGRPEGPLFVRDLGPERNAAFMAGHSDRTPWLYAMDATGAPRLMPYDEGIELLWGNR